VTYSIPDKPQPPAHAFDQALQLSPDNVLKHLFVERQVSNNLAQLCVFVFQELQPLDLSWKQTIILFLPVKIGRLANASPPANLSNRHTICTLLQDKCLLRVRKFARFHRLPLLPSTGTDNWKTLIYHGPNSGEHVNRKTPLTAADTLNDRVIPFFEEHGIKVDRVLTDRGTEYCGSHERHEYELYLAVEDIDHTRTKVKSPQTNGI
jgi:hypothetical protein